MSNYKITPNYKRDFAKKDLEGFKKRLEWAILMRLQMIGEQFIENSRGSAGNYKDQTGALRSSIGYVVLNGGRAYSEGGFIPVRGAMDGAAKGRDYIETIARKYPTGWILVGVAGQNYAAYVEARGYNVISMGAFAAKASLSKAVKEINDKLK